MSNANLRRAKEVKNDEFYTQYKDIENEISAYIEYDPDVFRGKTILCPCDDPEKSNFTKYFIDNFGANPYSAYRYGRNLTFSIIKC